MTDYRLTGRPREARGQRHVGGPLEPEPPDGLAAAFKAGWKATTGTCASGGVSSSIAVPGARL